MDMNRLAIDDGTPGGPLTVDRLPLPNDRNRSVLCLENEVVAILQYHQPVVGFTKVTSAFNDGFEDRADIGRRGSDHAQDIAAPGLVSQGLRELTGLGLHLVEQPDIADGDHRLIGESLQQRNLLVREGVDLSAAYDDGADALVLTQERHAEDGALTVHARPFLRVRKPVTFRGKQV